MPDLPPTSTISNNAPSPAAQTPQIKTARSGIGLTDKSFWLFRIAFSISWIAFAAYQIHGFVIRDFQVEKPEIMEYLDLIGLPLDSLALAVWCGALGGGINSFLAAGREYNAFMQDSLYPPVTLAETIWSAFRPAMSLVVGVITVLAVKLGLVVFTTSADGDSLNAITLGLVSFFAGLSSVSYLQTLAKKFFSLFNFDKKD